MTRFLIISFGVLLSSCGTGPVLQPLQVDLPDSYNLVAPLSAPKQNDVQWWQDFNDPILNALIQRGAARNLSLAEARERVREAAALARRDGYVISGDGLVQQSTSSTGNDVGTVSLDAEFNLAGEGFRRSEAAQARLQAAQSRETDAQRLVLSELTIAYIDLRFQQSSLFALQQDLQSRLRTERDVRTQLDAGAATQLDIIRASSLVAETRSQIPKTNADIIRQRNRISTLLGQPASESQANLGPRKKQPLPKISANLGVPVDLLRARPDIREAEYNYAAAVSDVAAAQAARFPSLSLSGLLTAPTSGASGTAFVAGLVLPVFSQPALAATTDAAASRANQAYLQWRIAVLNAVEEVENALASLEGARQAVRAAKVRVRLDTEALNLSRQLLGSRGNARVFDLLDQERTLANSRAALTLYTRDLSVDYVNLRVALGQGHPLISGE